MSGRIVAMAGVVGAMLAAGTPAHALPNLVTNGDFEQTTRAGSYQIGSAYQSGGVNVDDVTGWTTNGYNFVYAPKTGTTSGTTADNGGATGQYGAVSLWGPGNGSANGLTLSPTGGNFIAADGAFQTAAISQSITGLVVGQRYDLSFYWAAGQQSGFDGPTTDYWTASLGSQSFNTGIDSIVTHGFSGWAKTTFTYTATAATETLSFLATGTPSGVPPFALLDGVSLTQNVPEPASLSVLAAGALAAIGARRKRRHI